MTDTIYYFAFGSNIDSFQMKARCPNSNYLKNLRLDGWKLVISPKHFGANIIKTNDPSDHVWGTLYTITKTDELALDQFEGIAKRHYIKTYLLHPDHLETDILTYTVPQCTAHDRPYKDYHARILRGLMERDICPKYTNNFKNMAIRNENNPERSYVGDKIGN